jgi:hypothetical protein
MVLPPSRLGCQRQGSQRPYPPFLPFPRQACTLVARGRSTWSSPKGIPTGRPPSASATACSTRMSTRCEPLCSVAPLAWPHILAASLRRRTVPSHPLLLPACAGRDRCAWTSSTRPGPRCLVRNLALLAPPRVLPQSLRANTFMEAPRRHRSPAKRHIWP